MFSIKLKGNTGLELVKQALERGHQVTALVRNPGALEAFSKNENFKVIIIGWLLIKDRLNDVLLLIFIKGGQMWYPKGGRSGATSGSARRCFVGSWCSRFLPL